jgi:hypothetical protein
MRNTSTKLLVIAITTAAIIAAVVSISAATPAFAKINCNETQTVCSGGSGCGPGSGCPPGTSPNEVPGGGGSRIISEVPFGPVVSSSGGTGGNTGEFVGGVGRHFTCDTSGVCSFAGGSGQHFKGPGGNSDNAPPP